MHDTSARRSRSVLMAIVVWVTKMRCFECSLMPNFKYKYRVLPLLFYFCCSCCTCTLFLGSSSFLPSSSKLFELQVCIPPSMAHLLHSQVEKIVSRVTPSIFWKLSPSLPLYGDPLHSGFKIPMNGLPYSPSLILLT